MSNVIVGIYPADGINKITILPNNITRIRVYINPVLTSATQTVINEYLQLVRNKNIIKIECSEDIPHEMQEQFSYIGVTQQDIDNVLYKIKTTTGLTPPDFTNRSNKNIRKIKNFLYNTCKLKLNKRLLTQFLDLYEQMQ